MAAFSKMNKFLQIFKIKDLRNKVLIVIGLLVAFRLLAAIPIPGIDAASLRQYFNSNQLFGFLNLFSGGGLDNLSLVMLGVGPYITATIVMQLLTIIFPKFKQLYYEEGAQGRAKFNQYSRLLTIPLAILQSYSFLAILIRQGVMDSPGTIAMITNIAVVTAGTMVTLWLGEIINEQKIGNGISLIILAGIVSGLPKTVQQFFVSYSADQLPTFIGFIIIAVLLVAGVVYLNEGERKIPVTYARRVRGNKLFGGSSSYLPLKVNQAGMIPLIFAVSVLLFPQFLAQILGAFGSGIGATISSFINQILANQVFYGCFYFGLVFAFTYFYTTITFNPEEISKNLQRGGGFVPGIRPGENTTKFFSHAVSRLTFFGALFLGLIAVLPILLQPLTGTSALSISGTALLIVVAVALETMRQINSQLTVREYDSIK